jgi:hypothetical protein
VIALAQSGAAELGHSLKDSGLNMRSFHVHHGARPQPETAPHRPAEAGVVLDILV